LLLYICGNPINTDKVINPYESKKTVATIVASEDAENYINYTFPDIRTYRMRLGLTLKFLIFQKQEATDCFYATQVEG
jgi:hypothetical protein